MEEQAMSVVEASTEYVGRWNRLISTTNWEKGRIIQEWRDALQEAGASAGQYSDDVWSRQVGNVTPQHVGRLRRAFERFGDVFDQYPGLFWSHFQAAVEWTDAEMYLEGAVQNDWSVSAMRNQRWEAMGGRPELKPNEDDIMSSELDEDAPIYDDAPMPPTISESIGEVRGAVDFSEDDDSEPAPFDDESSYALPSAKDVPSAPLLRPFESLPPLPSDLNEAFELFKLAILNHKVSGWSEIARDDVLSVLESLKQLALAPTE
jgi:hypothetical protein